MRRPGSLCRCSFISQLAFLLSHDKRQQFLAQNTKCVVNKKNISDCAFLSHVNAEPEGSRPFLPQLTPDAETDLRRGSRILVSGAQWSFDPKGALSQKFSQNRGFSLKITENCMILNKSWGQGGPVSATGSVCVQVCFQTGTHCVFLCLLNEVRTCLVAHLA